MWGHYMNEILATSKIYGNYQTIIPEEIRKKNNIDKDTILEWCINKEGNTIVNFRKRRDVKNLIGAFSTKEKTNAVELKRGL